MFVGVYCVQTTEAQPHYLNASLPTAVRCQDLVARMTLDEKLAQLTSFWFNDLHTGQNEPDRDRMQELLGNGIGQITRVGGSSTLTPVGAAHAGNTIQRFLVEQTRLGIPAILHEECCLGYLGLGGTAFPQMIGLASSWNPNLAERVTTEIRKQMLAVGARQGLGPVLDIASDPRWGRIEETFGEDPLLVTQFGMAYIRGLQGSDKTAGVMATGKHFVGHSLSNGGLNCAPVQLGKHALWDTYLMPFQAAIKEAHIWSIMNAYPELDGEVVAASRGILTDLLRGTLGFDGLLVSDYAAIPMIHNYHHIAENERSAAVKALRAGIDIELPTRQSYGDPLRAAVDAGEISTDEIDAVLTRVLQTKFELGLFERPYVEEAAVAGIFETAEQRKLAKETAIQSMVLLKNDGLLPLGKPQTIAVIGPNAASARNLIGDYSYPAMLELMTYKPLPDSAFISGVDQDHLHANSVKTPTILDGIRESVGGAATVLYAQGCTVLDQDRSGFEEAVNAARQADVVVLVLGDKSGLVPDCSTGETRDRAELGLPGVQEELARAVVDVGKPVVAVLVNGRPVSSPWLHENVAAILEAWLPGEEGAAAVADVLFGRANPGGKLPVTVARSAGQIPVTYRHPASGSHSNWYHDYVEMPVGPLYPFGHGLSYTSFVYSDLEISTPKAKSGEQVEISLNVANTGKVKGDEVIQLYVCDETASSARPVKELKGFSRVALEPGQKCRLTFCLPVNMLAYYDDQLELIVEAGTIKLMVGSSSEDIRLQGKFEISGASKTPVADRIFDCPVTLQ
jgi:beta-glucosidase